MHRRSEEVDVSEAIVVTQSHEEVRMEVIEITMKTSMANSIDQPQ